MHQALRKSQKETDSLVIPKRKQSETISWQTETEAVIKCPNTIYGSIGKPEEAISQH